MINKITSIAELRQKIERDIKRHENGEEQVSGQIGISHGLLAMELRDVLKLIDSLEASVKNRIEITKEEAKTILILCREAESRCGLRYDENNLYEKLYKILDKKRLNYD